MIMVSKKTNERLKIISFSLTIVIFLFMYYFRIKKLNLWPYEIKSRMALVTMVLCLLVFCIYVSMKKSISWYQAILQFATPLAILFVMMYVPERFFIYLPFLLPMILMKLFYGAFSACFLHLTAAICYYFSNFMEIEQILFIMVMGLIIIFIVEICEDKILYILSSVLMLLISIILNLIYQYMLYEKLDAILVLKNLLPFFLTLIPLYANLIFKKIHSISILNKLREVNQDDYVLIEKLYKEDSITFYHSMEVSDLANRVAITLGINKEITMAGSRYHEVGRLLGKNYVVHGIKLLNQHGFPKEVIQIIQEHNSKVNKPQTMESAVVMLSDTIISTFNTIIETRGMENLNKNKIVKNILELRLESGILDDVLLNTKDYVKLKQAFVQAYK